MFNLLRMDLYRLRRSRSVYVCFGVLMAASVTVFVMLWLMAVPQGQETALRIHMLSAHELESSRSLLDGVDVLELFRQTALDGGMYNVTMGICIMLFVCADYHGGFIKNIMAFHENRYAYVGSKVITAGILNAVFLAGHFAFTLLLNWMFKSMVPWTNARDVVFYLAWAWVLTTAFAALEIVICICTRSVAAGSLAAVLLGGGVVVMMLYGLLNMFHAGGWLNHTIYLSLSAGPSKYASVQDLKIFAVGAGFLILYTAAAGIVLKKQDI